MKLPMKLLRIAGLCLVAMVAMAMATAATASAAPVWEQCVKGASGTKYSEHQCLTAEAKGEWGWEEVKSTEKVISHGSLLLRDKEIEILKKSVAVSCTGKDEGSVGPGKFDRITNITEIKCVPDENCTKITKEAEPRNLPWQTELVEEAGKVRDVITNGKTGESAPGWAVTCEVEGISATDVCTNEKVSTAVENERTKGVEGELLVLATFEKETPGANCSFGAKEGTGQVTGKVAILKENGWGLRVS